MDRYTKTVLTVIAGCLLVLVGNQMDFSKNAYAGDTASGGGGNSGVIAVAKDALGNVYFTDNGLNIIHCKSGSCANTRLS